METLPKTNFQEEKKTHRGLRMNVPGNESKKFSLQETLSDGNLMKMPRGVFTTIDKTTSFSQSLPNVSYDDDGDDNRMSINSLLRNRLVWVTFVEECWEDWVTNIFCSFLVMTQDRMTLEGRQKFLVQECTEFHFVILFQFSFHAVLIPINTNKLSTTSTPEIFFFAFKAACVEEKTETFQTFFRFHFISFSLTQK